MAKAELIDHPKFKKLRRLLGEPTPHVVGYLECMWRQGYQIGSAVLGDADDVEAAAEFPGERGRFASAAHQAGFIDQDADGTFLIHDLYDHAPKYAQMRMRRKGTAPDQTCPTTERLLPELAETVTDVPDLGTTVPGSAGNGNECATKGRGKRGEEKGERVEDKGQTQDTRQRGPTPEEFREEWNRAAEANGWKTCLQINEDRERHLRARLKDPRWREGWRSALVRAGPIPALRGEGVDGTWKADVDWFLRPGTVTRLLEGKYDGWGKPTGSINDKQRAASLRYDPGRDDGKAVQSGDGG